MMMLPTFTVSIPDLGDVSICAEAEALARIARGEIVLTHREFDALAAASEEKLFRVRKLVPMARLVVMVKKVFAGATINRILTAKEAKLDRASRYGIAAGNPRRQAGPAPEVDPPCEVCGGGCDEVGVRIHLEGCMMGID